jgi:3-hydroxybutyryl-CoA dehydrogenase
MKLSTGISLHFKGDMNIQSICVCGAGTMGIGIAQVSATAGFKTILYEQDGVILEKSKTIIQKNLQTLVDKKRVAEGQKEKIFQRIFFTNQLLECRADVVIEAIIENYQAKISLFNQLAEINIDKTIFATNTSSLSVAEIGNNILNPHRFAGMHFFNPATLMKLVEIVKAEKTSDETVKIISDLAKQFGKTAVVCKDSPGFIVNRVARPYYIESLRLVEEGQINFTLIDELLEATGFKMGPFKLMDLIGNDINYSVSCSIHEQLNQPARLKPSYIQKQKVEKGELGKKSGKGYYEY